MVVLIVLGALGLTQYWSSVSFGALFAGISDLIPLRAPIGYRMRRLGITTLAGALLTALGLVLDWLIGGAFYMLLALVRFKRQPSPSEAAPGTAPVQSPKSLLATYFAPFRFTNPLFRFVLLKALAVTVGAAIGLGFGLPYAHWIPVFTLVVLQPDLEQTLNIFMQRLIGTILAATLAAVLRVRVHTQYLIALVIMVSAFSRVSMHGANMLISNFFSTVMILLLLDLPTPGSLTDVWAGVLNAFIGVLIAVVVVFLFLRPSQKTESSSVASG